MYDYWVQMRNFIYFFKLKISLSLTNISQKQISLYYKIGIVQLPYWHIVIISSYISSLPRKANKLLIENDQNYNID